MQKKYEARRQDKKTWHITQGGEDFQNPDSYSEVGSFLLDS